MDKHFIVEEDRLILFGSFAESVILLGGDDSEYPQANMDLFDQINLYESPRSLWESRIDEDYYQGLNVMRVLERKSDGKLFGFEYWEDISKNGDSYLEPNGDEHDFEWDDGAFVFLPVKPFTITGFTF